MPLVYEMSCLRKRYLSKKDCGCLICHFSLYIYFHIGKQEEKLFEINKGIIMLLLKGHAIMNFTSGILQRIQANFCNVFLFLLLKLYHSRIFSFCLHWNIFYSSWSHSENRDVFLYLLLLRWVFKRLCWQWTLHRTLKGQWKRLDLSSRWLGLFVCPDSLRFNLSN